MYIYILYFFYCGHCLPTTCVTEGSTILLDGKQCTYLIVEEASNQFVLHNPVLTEKHSVQEMTIGPTIQPWKEEEKGREGGGEGEREGEREMEGRRAGGKEGGRDNLALAQGCLTIYITHHPLT